MWKVKKRRKILLEEKQFEGQVWAVNELWICSYYSSGSASNCMQRCVDLEGQRFDLRFIDLDFASREMFDAVGEIRVFIQNR